MGKLLAVLCLVGLLVPSCAFAVEQATMEYVKDERIQATRIDIDALMQEIKKEIKQRRGVQTELNDIAQKYIPLDMDKETVLRQFKDNGFRVKESYYYQNSPDYKKYDVTYGAYKGLWLFPSFLFGHDFIIYFDFNQNRLARVRAVASLSHL